MKTPFIGRKCRVFKDTFEVAQYDNGYGAQMLGVAKPHTQTSQFYEMGVLDAKEDAKKPTFDQMLEGVCQ